MRIPWAFNCQRSHLQVFLFFSFSFSHSFFHSQGIQLCTGIVSPFVGSGKAGKMDGNGLDASFYYPFGVAIDQQTGDLFVADNSNHLIRKINQQGMYMYLLFTHKHNTYNDVQEMSRHSLDQNMALRTGMGKLQSCFALVEYALMRAVSLCLFVIVQTTKSGEYNSMVCHTLLRLPPPPTLYNN